MHGASGLLADGIEEVHITDLEGLGSSYRMKGYFTLKVEGRERPLKISFDGVAFGGNYGGHNVNVNLSEEGREILIAGTNNSNVDQIEELLSEIQRRLLNNEMVVDYDTIKPEEKEDLGTLTGI